MPHTRKTGQVSQYNSLSQWQRGVGRWELGQSLIVRSRTVRDPANVAPIMGEVEEYAEGNRPVKVKECPVGPEISYIAFPVAKNKVEVWLHMGFGIMSTVWSYELFQEFLDMQNGEGNGNPLQDSYLENPMDGGAS